MQIAELQSLVITLLSEIQKLSGRQWYGLNPDDKPIGALDGFDSVSGVEATVMIEEKLGCEFDIESVFVSDDGRRALTVKQIAERLARLLVSKGGKR